MKNIASMKSIIVRHTKLSPATELNRSTYYFVIMKERRKKKREIRSCI